MRGVQHTRRLWELACRLRECLKLPASTSHWCVQHITRSKHDCWRLAYTAPAALAP
jgi:hypothetical protein